ncbi:MAG: response regulator [Planctomycetaceae bacterium]|nr:response regulator [Planctomycetaceae bacterium]
MSMSPRRLLYVDDEAANLIVFESTFEDLFEVHCAGSAAEALEMAEQLTFPVVVADQRMPEMTGVEMFRILRKRSPQTQRIILSGYSEPGALIDAINEGAIFQFVRKPWDAEDLHSVILRALDAHDLQVQNSVLTSKLVFADRAAMLGQSAAKIAHELRNHVNLLPLIEAIEEDYPRDEQLQEMASIARMTHERLIQLIEEIRSFLRPEMSSGEFARISLGACVRELLAFLRFNDAVPLQKVEVRVDDDPLILGHSVKLQQVLLNLLKNGIEAVEGVPDGRVQLGLSRKVDNAVLIVRDNGCGIPVDLLQKIWKPFFSTKGDRGTGLGLDVVQSIVEAHHGSIQCHSKVGEGTEFRLTLPLFDAPAASRNPDHHVPSVSPSPDSRPGTAESGERVLVPADGRHGPTV